MVRTSSSSQAGARRPRARRPPSATAEACHRRRDRPRAGAAAYSPEPCPCPCARCSPRSTPATTPRSPRAGTPSAWSAVTRTSRCAGCCSPSTRRRAVVDEVLAAGADLLVTHHPLLLTPVHGVPADDPKGRLVHRLIRGRRRRCSSRTPTPTGRPTPGSTTRWPPSWGCATPCRWSRRTAIRGPGSAGWASWSAPMTLREFAGAGGRGAAGDGRRRPGRGRSGARSCAGSPSAAAAAGR